MRRFLEESFNSVKFILSDLEEMGIKGVDLSEKSLAILAKWEKETPEPAFDDIQRNISLCSHCAPDLSTKAKLLPPPSGKIRVLFIDAMPGKEALDEGTSMGGEAGVLLWKIIQSMGLLPDNVYITHCLMCRVSKRRLGSLHLPCRDFLKDLIALFKPEVLCALGEGAGRFLSGKDETLSRLRGHFSSFESIPLMITHHPEDLLLHPELKRETWEDVKKMIAVLNRTDGA
ncbi:uracil-DNA glycosylase [Desulfococcaceae bacterium OttesenSCG-928-F15]|nr:uracil-DNA glycosylase [Desulfococcaceae bacterium OttesenSCG-928-F15]